LCNWVHITLTEHLQAEKHGDVRFVYQTAASFVSTRAGLEPRGLLTSEEILESIDSVNTSGIFGRSLHGSSHAKTAPPSQRAGGLIVVGSYVPKTTKQLSEVFKSLLTENILVDAEKVITLHRKYISNSSYGSLNTGIAPLIEQEIIDPTVQQIDNLVKAGKDVVLYTSREFMTGAELSDTAVVSKTITDIISRLSAKPHFIISKGGITSFEVARYGLGVKTARVLGQIEAGVPVWRLNGSNKFAGVPYIVFPGNVGSEDALSRVAMKLGVNRNPNVENSQGSKAVRKPPVLGDYRDRWNGKAGMLAALTTARASQKAIAAFNIC
jgi:hypothetical protein